MTGSLETNSFIAAIDTATETARSGVRLVHSTIDKAPADAVDTAFNLPHATYPTDIRGPTDPASSRTDLFDATDELSEIGQDSELITKLVWALLYGGARPADLRRVTVFGIDAGRDYVAFRARPRSGHRREELARELSDAGSRPRRDGLVAENLDGDLIGFLATPPIQVRGGVVGIGPGRTPDRLTESFRLATRAVDSACAFGLHGVHDFDGLGLLPTILADTDIGEALERRYLSPVLGNESQPELLSTIRAYFACGMHVDRTAKKLFLHPNTLRYRITRFERLVGARLRDPVVAMEVWWALQHNDLACGRAW